MRVCASLHARPARPPRRALAAANRAVRAAGWQPTTASSRPAAAQPALLPHTCCPCHGAPCTARYRLPHTTPLRPQSQRGAEVILFGGEFSDHTRDKVYVYNHLYRFNADKQRWSQVVAPHG